MNDKYMPYKDSSLTPEVRADDLLSRMSIEEKMGQIQGYNPANWSNDNLENDYPHGVGEVSFLVASELKSAKQTAENMSKIQKKVMELSEHSIPAIFHIETLCGVLMPGATSFPSGIAQGSTWNPSILKKMSSIIRREARAVGMRHAFAPVLDISRDSRFGRQGETYGEDPVLASEMGTAYIQGIQNDGNLKDGMIACAKHFLGYHATQGGIHASSIDIPSRVLREVYAKPFQAAINNGKIASLMNCYSEINGEPMAGSKAMLTDLLRNEMGFNGIVVADYSSISEIFSRHKVCNSEYEAGIKALKAGIDVELPSAKCYGREMLESFKNGAIDIEILNRSVYRLLLMKFRLGLFENYLPDSNSDIHKIIGSKRNKEVSLKIAKQSLVLVKNNGVLPISGDIKKITIIGHHANTIRSYFGGYSFASMTESDLGVANTMAGVEIGKNNHVTSEYYQGTKINVEHPDTGNVTKSYYPHSLNVVEQIQQTHKDIQVEYVYGYSYAGTDEAYHNEALSKAADSDLIIITLGGKYGWGTASSTGEGIDSTNINLPACQENFIKKLAELHVPSIGIHFDGRPISSDAADKFLDAIIEAWSPGEMGGEAIVSLLFGRYSPAGRLPVTVPYSSSQIPVYYNHHYGSSWHVNTISAFSSYVDMPHEPRYCFGHGLTYTSFKYNNIMLSKSTVNPEEEVDISFDITNVGKYDSDEVVQLYVTDCNGRMIRPVKELAGFIRIFLQVGERRQITFTIKPAQFAFLNEDMEWQIEAGDMEIQIGASSEDIRIIDKFSITSDLVIDGRCRPMAAKVKVDDYTQFNYETNI